MPPDPSRPDLLQGTLDLLSQGSLYPALHGLEHRGWIKAEWGISELGRRARFYSLTASGRKQLEIEAVNSSKLSDALARVLKMA